MNQLLFAALILMQGTPGAPSQDLEGRAKQAVAAQRFAEARVLYRQLAAEDPLNSDHLIWVGRISGWMGDYDTGSAALDTVLEREPRNTDALIAKAYLFLHQRRYSSAQALLDRAQAIVPESVDLRMALARNMFYQGRVKEAREQVEKVLAAEPSNSEAGQLNAQIDAQPRVYRFEMSLGFGQDRFSFASPATVESISAGYTGTATRAALIYEGWNKFGDVSHRGGITLTHRFARSVWLRGGAIIAPGALAVAREDYSGGLSANVRPRIVTGGDYRYLRFASSRVHVASPSMEYYFERPVWVQAALFTAWTDDNVPGHSRIATQSFGVRYNHQIAPLVLHAGYARGNESYSALSIDRLGRFRANTFIGGVDFKPVSSLTFGTFYSYQRRDSGSTQNSFGISLTVRK
ncbi:MAG: hypothetical protein DMG11_12750 [Acidobacteria bacterium]|nr:MAG: hypothetical protein DMG11_12750 [Acidobacteriota bacterium]